MNYRIAMVGACPFPVPQGSQTLLRDTALLAQSAGNEVHLVVYGHGMKNDPVIAIGGPSQETYLGGLRRFAKVEDSSQRQMCPSLRGVRDEAISTVCGSSPLASGAPSSGLPLASGGLPLASGGLPLASGGLPLASSGLPLEGGTRTSCYATPPAITLHRGRLLPAFLPGARRTDAGLSPVKPFLDLSLVNTLRRVIRDHAIEIVHAHNYEALFVAMCAGTRPIVYHAHNAMADELPHFLPFGAYLGHGIDLWLPRQADCVIAPHAPLADYLRNLGCKDIEIIPPAIDPGLFTPAPVTDALPPVVYAGNLDAYQNLPLLYAAMRRVRDAIPQARLIIATSCPATIPGAEVVPVTGFASLRAVLERDAVFACPRVSWSGYPIKLLNAMAAAKPTVCCQSAAHPITNAQNGLAVPDNNPEAFAAAIISLLQTPSSRAQLGANARQTTIEHHSPAGIAAKLHALYCRLG